MMKFIDYEETKMISSEKMNLQTNQMLAVQNNR